MHNRSGWGRRWLCLGLVGLACGCSSQDSDRLARVGRKAAAKADGLTEGARGRLANAWQAMKVSTDEGTVDGRVATRLRLDKALAGVSIQVTALGKGQIRLRGTVADLPQRRRAVDLAQTTFGVTGVFDELTVEGEGQ